MPTKWRPYRDHSFCDVTSPCKVPISVLPSGELSEFWRIFTCMLDVVRRRRSTVWSRVPVAQSSAVPSHHAASSRRRRRRPSPRYTYIAVAPPGGGEELPPYGWKSKNYVICVCFHCHGTSSYHTTNTLQGRRTKSHVDTQTIQPGLGDLVL